MNTALGVRPFGVALNALPIYSHGMSTEIIFEVREDEVDGGYNATALGYGIVTEAETLKELREMVKEAVHCHFGDAVPGVMPKIIRLHFVRDEVLAA